MSYRLTNNSHQEGMVHLEGQWVTMAPGEVKYSEVFPGAKTQNIVVKKIVASGSEVEYKNARPASAQKVLVQSNASDSDSASESSGKKEEEK